MVSATARLLLTLMAILTQSLLTLVRRHLTTLVLLTVWHNFFL